MISRFEKFHHNIAMSHKFISKIKSWEMNKFGLKAANVMCLFFLGKNTDEGLTPTELCELCREDKSGISKSLAVLKKHGYVTCDGGKSYKQKYMVTQKGIEVYEKISECIVGAVVRAGEGLKEEERKIFHKVLGQIVSNLHIYCEENNIK